jgi:hypothetical protein
MDRNAISTLACECRGLTHEELARELARCLYALSEARRLIGEGWNQSALGTIENAIGNSKLWASIP